MKRPGFRMAEQFGKTCSIRPLARPAFSVINSLQDEPNPAVQLDALALTFTIISQAAGLDPHELVSRARRQMPHADAVPNPLIEAIRDYAVGEMSL